MGVEQNENKQPANVVNLRKSVFLHADVMQILVAILCQIVVANQNLIIR